MTTASIMTKLAAATRPLSLDELAANMKCGKRVLSSALSRLCRLRRVSMLKEQGSYARYFLTPAQVEQWKAPAPPRKRPPVGAGLTAAQLAARLRFLTEISQRPAFLGHALLGEIITDYRRALNRAHEKDEAS